MSNKEFEDKVLEKLWTIEADMSSLKTKVNDIDRKIYVMDKKMDRIDNKIDTRADDLEASIRLNGQYIDQAFRRISELQV